MTGKDTTQKTRIIIDPLQYEDLVHKVTKRYLKSANNYSMDRHDLFQEGMIAVIKCIPHYDDSKGNFINYAAFRINNAMRTLFYKTSLEDDKKKHVLKSPTYYITEEMEDKMYGDSDTESEAIVQETLEKINLSPKDMEFMKDLLTEGKREARRRYLERNNTSVQMPTFAHKAIKKKVKELLA